MAPKIYEWTHSNKDELRQTREGCKLESEVVKSITEIVKAIVNTHKFYKFMPYEDCMMTGLEGVLRSLDKFDPNYMSEKTGKRATYFNYISLTAKRTILFTTMRWNRNNNKHTYVENLESIEDDQFDKEVDKIDADFNLNEIKRNFNVVVIRLYQNQNGSIGKTGKRIIKELNQALDAVIQGVKIGPKNGYNRDTKNNKTSLTKKALTDTEGIKRYRYRQVYKIIEQHRDEIVPDSCFQTKWYQSSL